jgi:hypothetical protein
MTPTSYLIHVGCLQISGSPFSSLRYQWVCEWCVKEAPDLASHLAYIWAFLKTAFIALQAALFAMTKKGLLKGK